MLAMSHFEVHHKKIGMCLSPNFLNLSWTCPQSVTFSKWMIDIVNQSIHKKMALLDPHIFSNMKMLHMFGDF